MWSSLFDAVDGIMKQIPSYAKNHVNVIGRVSIEIVWRPEIAKLPSLTGDTRLPCPHPKGSFEVLSGVYFVINASGNFVA